MWLSGALVIRQTALPYFFLPQQQQQKKKVRKRKAPGESGWAWQGQCGGEMLKRQFPSSSPHTVQPGAWPYHFTGSNGCKLDNHKHLR